jgi:phosphoglycerate kinase
MLFTARKFADMKKLTDLSLRGRRVFVRVDFNVPFDEQGRITDDSRIRAALPTLTYIRDAGGRLIIASHLGRPKGKPSAEFSLRPVVSALSALLGCPVQFASDCIGKETEALTQSLKDGDVVLLENLRFYSEEEAGDVQFSTALAALAEVYVNDAFGAAHRAHASTAVMATHFPDDKAPGFLMQAEIESIENVMEKPRRPFVSVIGGAKVSSKISILENLLEKTDVFIIGGGMVFTFVRAMGGKVGNSLVEEDMIETAGKMIDACRLQGKALHLPVDALCNDHFGEDGTPEVYPVDAIPDGWMGLDIGPASIQNFEAVLSSAGTVLWNGPMGVFEMDAFAEGTRAIGEAIAKASESGTCFSLVGGGDSVAAIQKFGLRERVSYVSTGGGAMLECMEGKVLPGMAALQ